MKDMYRYISFYILSLAIVINNAKLSKKMKQSLNTLLLLVRHRGVEPPTIRLRVYYLYCILLIFETFDTSIIEQQTVHLNSV